MSLQFRITRTSLFAAGIAVTLALAPALAEARAGSSSTGTSSSMGSRGSRTYQNNGSQSLERSVTPQQQRTSPLTAPQAAPGYRAPSFFQNHPFLSGLMGGFLGAGLFGMLSGHGMFGGMMGGIGFLGLLFQLALIGGVIWVIMAMFRRRSGAEPAFASGPNTAYREPPTSTSTLPFGGLGGGGRAANPEEVQIADADFQAFERLLMEIQAAWSRGDIAGLRQFVTPEMLSYFSEQLSSNASRRIENRVEDVQFLKGDLVESWREGDMTYATVTMRWRARDYMVRAGGTEVVSGDPRTAVDAAETWTLLRSGTGGHWLLSAIQQI
jgi:predicted lipid-binding transport protein (Tim44 family)